MVMTIDWTIIPDYLPIFMKGLQTTIVISVVSIILGFVGGILIGMCRISRNPLVFGASTVYVEAFRGTPLLIQIFLIYLGLPQLGIYVDSPLVAGLIALSLNSAAYQSEIFRGGVQSISIGQIEAARSLGMTYNQALFNVVIPQALRNALPPYTNEFITMIKDSSLVMTIGVLELTLRGKLISATTGQSIPVLLFVAILYFVLTFSTSRVLRYVERRFAIPGMMGSESK